MSDVPLPDGVTEADYHAIEAAVMETVRGRWFLNEFARRTRAGEIRLMLDAVTRLEHVVTSRALPGGDASPQARLLLSRAADISERLFGLVEDMRADDLDERVCASLEAEARAVAGLARITTPEPAALEPPAAPPPRPEPPRLERPPVSEPAPQLDPAAIRERRLMALAALDALSTLEKLAAFA